MTTYEALHVSAAPVLHVFEQDGGWHWGITVPRPAGSGFKVVAFSEETFPAEAAARTDGDRVLRDFSDHGMRMRAH
ncbi:MAG: FIG00458016: hypothetical protein [uncultured Paraburkholderia sp.]|nr:MAG: FIG00458016: hypothetical protein [uncultured Paraburkholderia sp.]CAH2911574.1 MAG: FIG00458016: hypothetical protein [uncultured Paraburkholderia sp.]